jgi:hypothetical protein
MLSLKRRVKRETSLDKIRNGRLKSTELTVRGSTEYDTGASLACILYVSQQRREVNTSFGSTYSNKPK